MESQPQNPEFRINPENFHPYAYLILLSIACPLPAAHSDECHQLPTYLSPLLLSHMLPGCSNAQS